MVKYKLKRKFDISQDSYGGNQMWHPSKYHIETGCGPVALTNIFAYHMGLKLDRSELSKLQNEILKYLKGPVILPIQFSIGAKRLFSVHGITISTFSKTVFSSSSNRFDEALNMIKSSLESDRPIALLTGPNKLFSNEIYGSEFKNHWMLITDLDYVKEEKSWNISVSSWGDCHTLNLGKLVDSKLFTSLLSIKIEGKDL